MLIHLAFPNGGTIPLRLITMDECSQSLKTMHSPLSKQLDMHLLIALKYTKCGTNSAPFDNYMARTSSTQHCEHHQWQGSYWIQRHCYALQHFMHCDRRDIDTLRKLGPFIGQIHLVPTLEHDHELKEDSFHLYTLLILALQTLMHLGMTNWRNISKFLEIANKCINILKVT